MLLIALPLRRLRLARALAQRGPELLGFGSGGGGGGARRGALALALPF